MNVRDNPPRREAPGQVHTQDIPSALKFLLLFVISNELSYNSSFITCHVGTTRSNSHSIENVPNTCMYRHGASCE